MEDKKIDIIIDTDPGVDDAIALLYAFKSECFNIKLISSAGGNGPIENITSNAIHITELFNEEIPVVEGSPTPLVRPAKYATNAQGKSGLGDYSYNKKKLKHHPIEGEACDVIYQTLKSSKCEKCNEVVSNIVANAVATIGENLQVRRGKTITVDNGLIVSYVHTAIAPGLGKIGVLVALKSDASQDKLEELGKGIAMHIAATKPEFLTEADVPATKIDSEKEIARELAKKSGKPDNIVEKMVEGRVKKYYEENVLLNQAYIMDGNKKISDLLKDFEKETGKKVEIQEYVFFVLGEGIEKQTADFADEVASMVNKA